MNNHIVIYISPQTPYLAKFWFSSYGPKCSQPKRLQDSLKCNILRKKCGIKLTFCEQINIKFFCKLILSFLEGVARHAQSNNKFAISQQYFKKEVKDNVDFSHVDENQTLLQVATVNFSGHGQSCPKYPKQQFFKIFAIY